MGEEHYRIAAVSDGREQKKKKQPANKTDQRSNRIKADLATSIIVKLPRALP